jgi:hypothetical protein
MTGITCPPESSAPVIRKAAHDDFLGRFREIVSDPANPSIERVPEAGFVENGLVYLHNGNRVPLEGPHAYYGEFSKILVINRGVHEPQEELAFQEAVKQLPERPVMLELGAYWGHYSMWLKKVRPDATVFLVEPDAENLETGRANFEINGFDGEFIQRTVAKDEFTVDGFLKQRNLQRLHILHCDIQGAEIEMLEGCEQAMAAKRLDHLFISTHSQGLHLAAERMLKACAYRVEISSDFASESTAYDGFLMAHA